MGHPGRRRIQCLLSQHQAKPSATPRRLRIAGNSPPTYPPTPPKPKPTHHGPAAKLAGLPGRLPRAASRRRAVHADGSQSQPAPAGFSPCPRHPPTTDKTAPSSPARQCPPPCVLPLDDICLFPSLPRCWPGLVVGCCRHLPHHVVLVMVPPPPAPPGRHRPRPRAPGHRG